MEGVSKLIPTSGDDPVSAVHLEYVDVWRQVRRWPSELRRDLVGDIMDSLETEAPTAAPEWNEDRNARRCALIDKEIEGTLTAPERAELNLLQKQATAYRDRVAPVPIEGARRLHQELLREKRRGKRGAE